MKESVRGEDLVKWFSELSNKHIAFAGGKGASLAEMYNHKFPIPPGFVVTAQAYDFFMEETGLMTNVQALIDGVDIQNTTELQKTAETIKKMIVSAEMPKVLQTELKESYAILDVNKASIQQARGGALDILKNSHEPPFVAVRSSATTEDLAEASFAGQQDSFLNVKGFSALVQKVKECFASLFNARAIYYRKSKGFSKSSLAVVVQKMVDADKSGVMFSQSPMGGGDDVVIEAVWGLGEGIVSGMIKPDHYVVGRDLTVKDVQLAEKKVAVVRDSSGKTIVVPLQAERAMQQVLSSYELKKLASYGLQLEKHYEKPQDIEFAIAGSELFIVQSRPITTLGSEKQNEEVSGTKLLSGLGASSGVGTGKVVIVHSASELSKVEKGAVLVTEMTNPDMVVAMQRASAIVTDEGGLTSHAAIISREMGIPAVVGTGNATKVLKEGQMITVDGTHGVVVDGKGETKHVVIEKVVPTETEIKVIVDIPSFAVRAAQTGVMGVGLVRLEGIIAALGKHPVWFEKQNKIDQYISGLAAGLREIAQQFKSIWIRTSDLRSDEYSGLEGAPSEKEGNPMLGDHGIRYSLKHIPLLEAELKAIGLLANEFKDKEFGVMIPQVISVSEVRATKELGVKLGLPSNVVYGIMVETPAAVEIIPDLCDEGLSFISFGTNDLTQYMLAIDRNNASIQELYTELHPAVLNSIKYVIRHCRKQGVKTSICGQAGSKPEMVRFLLSQGIDCITVNADAARSVSELVASVELERRNQPIESREPQRGGRRHTLSYSKNALPISQPQNKELAPVMMQGAEKDIEEVLLEELNKDEYRPSLPHNEVPVLNDAIHIDSTLVEDSSKKLENELVEDVFSRFF